MEAFNWFASKLGRFSSSWNQKARGRSTSGWKLSYPFSMVDFLTYTCCCCSCCFCPILTVTSTSDFDSESLLHADTFACAVQWSEKRQEKTFTVVMIIVIIIPVSFLLTTTCCFIVWSTCRFALRRHADWLSVLAAKLVGQLWAHLTIWEISRFTSAHRSAEAARLNLESWTIICVLREREGHFEHLNVLSWHLLSPGRLAR